jgi:hypothetical protein
MNQIKKISMENVHGEMGQVTARTAIAKKKEINRT